MLQKVQQNKWLRLGMGVLGGILMAVRPRSEEDAC